MAKLKIITGEGNEILRARSVPVHEFGADLKKLVKDMKITMKKANGLGLAAPQIGENVRVFVCILDWNGKNERVVAMINPEIIERSAEMEAAEEGCLSLPGIFGNVERAREVTVKFFDEDGAQQILTLSGLDAREIQHENDHLDGVLFVDRMVVVSEGAEKTGKELDKTAEADFML